jgi:hypothetical protein
VETNLEGIFATKALLAIIAGERLDSKMYAFMALEVMVPTEALRANVALERPILLGMVVYPGMMVVGKYASCLTHTHHGHAHTR